MPSSRTQITEIKGEGMMQAERELNMNINWQLNRVWSDRANNYKVYSVQPELKCRRPAVNQDCRPKEHVTSILLTFCMLQAWSKHVSNKHYASILRVLSEYVTSMMRARYEHYAIILRELGEQVTSMMRACHGQDASIIRARCKPVTSTQ